MNLDTTHRNTRLLDECLASAKAHASFKSPNDRQLLQQVAGADANENDYLYGGFGSAVGIRAALHAIGIKLSDCRKILDFGCGPARILRWFKDVSGGSRLHGCDINPPAIEWCKANIGFAEFAINQGWPPLPYGDREFDLAYGISVLTHLDESMQMAWLEELFRVTTEGGIVLLTVHGVNNARAALGPAEFEQFRRKGFWYKAATVTAPVEGLPEFYQVAYHSEEYVRANWTKHFDVLGYFTHGCMYAQDLVVLQSKGSHPRFRTKAVPAGQRHPLAAVEIPRIGTSVGDSPQAQNFEVRCWAFNPAGEVPEVEIWIDGKSVGTCIPSRPQNQVRDAFPTMPAAANSGFSVMCSSDRLEKGWHVIWLTLKNDPTPLWATFFVCATSRSNRWRAKWLFRLRRRVGVLKTAPK